MKFEKSLIKTVLTLLLVIGVFVCLYLLMDWFGLIALVKDTEQFKIYVNQLGVWGIFLTIFLMAFAILFKMLPSAAVALASGAVYGHTWGTIYIIMGAWLGAVIAFSITRFISQDSLQRFLEKRFPFTQEQSQGWLMWGLFISRLIPVIPYDIVSYAMGITPLQLWRFSIATLFGLIPTSFFLAHVGSELMDTNFENLLSDIAFAGFLFLVPVAIAILIYYRMGYLKRGDR